MVSVGRFLASRTARHRAALVRCSLLGGVRFHRGVAHCLSSAALVSISCRVLPAMRWAGIPVESAISLRIASASAM